MGLVSSEALKPFGNYAHIWVEAWPTVRGAQAKVGKVQPHQRMPRAKMEHEDQRADARSGEHERGRGDVAHGDFDQ